MKKILLITLMLCVLTLPMIALATEGDEPVSDTNTVVGEDIEVDEGDMKITSSDLDADEVVGEGIEINDDEMKITSIGEESGEDLEVGITSDTDSVEEAANNFLWIGIGVVGVAILLTGGIFFMKKAGKTN